MLLHQLPACSKTPGLTTVANCAYCTA
jgi:hypothetical protein